MHQEEAAQGKTYKYCQITGFLEFDVVWFGTLRRSLLRCPVQSVFGSPNSPIHKCLKQGAVFSNIANSFKDYFHLTQVTSIGGYCKPSALYLSFH